MRDLTWIEDAHWIEAFCRAVDSALAKPFLIDLNGEKWTVATDACRILAIKGEHGFEAIEEGFEETEAHVVRGLTAPTEWRDVDPAKFDAFFDFDWDRKGYIGQTIIDREAIADSGVLRELDVSWVQVSHGLPAEPVYFRGEGWVMAIAALDPAVEYQTPRLEIGEVVR